MGVFPIVKIKRSCFSFRSAQLLLNGFRSISLSTAEKNIPKAIKIYNFKKKKINSIKNFKLFSL